MTALMLGFQCSATAHLGMPARLDERSGRRPEKKMGQASKERSACVLIVEDEPLILLGTVALVEDLGYQVIEACSADEAIPLLEARSDICVVFTDVNMAGTMDGLELAMFAWRRWPPLKFIIVSGAHRLLSGDMPEGARFFAEPYDPKAVSEALHVLVAEGMGPRGSSSRPALN